MNVLGKKRFEKEQNEFLGSKTFSLTQPNFFILGHNIRWITAVEIKSSKCLGDVFGPT